MIWRVNGQVEDSVTDRSEPGLAWAAVGRAREIEEIFSGSVYLLVIIMNSVDMTAEKRIVVGAYPVAISMSRLRNCGTPYPPNLMTSHRTEYPSSIKSMMTRFKLGL